MSKQRFFGVTLACLALGLPAIGCTANVEDPDVDQTGREGDDCETTCDDAELECTGKCDDDGCRASCESDHEDCVTECD
jgi:hypothetical protein